MAGGMVGDARKRAQHDHDGAPCWTPTCAPAEGLAGHYVADDAYGDPCVWRGLPDDPLPQLALHSDDVRDSPELWAAIVALVGGAR